MKYGDSVRLKLAVVALAVALMACIGTIPVRVEANSVENVKVFDSPLDF